MMLETAIVDQGRASATTSWQIEPKSFLSRHFEIYQDEVLVTTLQMSLWREGCQFSIAGHDFAIRKLSIFKDAFQLVAGDESFCDVKRNFWSRRFELAAAGQAWVLQPASWFSTAFQLLAGAREVGRIRRAGWFSRRRVAEFESAVPPPIQVLAIFLALIIAQRQQKST